MRPVVPKLLKKYTIYKSNSRPSSIQDVPRSPVHQDGGTGGNLGAERLPTKRINEIVKAVSVGKQLEQTSNLEHDIAF